MKDPTTKVSKKLDDLFGEGAGERLAGGIQSVLNVAMIERAVKAVLDEELGHQGCCKCD